MLDFLYEYFKNSIELKEMFIDETIVTIYLTLVTALIAGFFGIILGVILSITEEGSILENATLHSILDKIINIGRSIPFVILIAIIAPFTRFLLGTTIGNAGALVPLVVGTTPFYARQVQNALAEVDKGVIEAAQAMGFSPTKIITNVYLSEAKEGLIRAGAVTIISLIGLTAMAGAVGAGGLGKVAISYGYYRFKDDITLVSTILILILVFIVQAISNIIIKLIKH